MKVLKTIGFWLVQCTWGFVMTFIGALVICGLMICGKKPKHIGPVVYIEVGSNWGGLELGGFFICHKGPVFHTIYHECGHTIQNMIWGPLYPFVIGMPSIARYWLRNFKTHLTKSLFNLVYLICALAITTGLACFCHYVIDVKALVIICEIFRIYFLLISIWFSSYEIHKYDKGYVDYDDAWFEGQASKLGYKYFAK